jgi:hypothetical protein
MSTVLIQCLCRSGIIPSEYHDYYKSLPSSSNVDDKLADTDAEEEQADSDQEWQNIYYITVKFVCTISNAGI